MATVPASFAARRRPVLRAMLLTLSSLGLIYAAFAVYLATRPVIISFDPLQKFRDSLPKPAKATDAAWPAYREALVALGYEKGRPKDDAIFESLGTMPGTEGWASISKWVDAGQPAIVAARAATKRPMFGFPLAQQPTGADAAFFQPTAELNELDMDGSNRENFTMFAVLLPQLATLRGLGNVFLADMFRAAEQGDGERATQDVEAALALSIHVSEGRLLISDLVAMAMRVRTQRDLLALLEWRPEVFTEAQLKRLQIALRSVPASLERIELSAERLLFEDAVQRMYSDDGAGDGWFVPSWKQLKFLQDVHAVSAGVRAGSDARAWVYASFLGAIRPLGVWAVAGRRDTLARHAEFMQAVEQVPTTSPREALAASKAVHARFGMDPSDRHAATRFFLQSVISPALAGATVNFARDRACRQVACAAIAAELFRRANKRWPSDAAELAAFNGGTAPSDPWAEGPLRMASDAAGFRMWSVGRNGTDEGGDPSQIDESSEQGDWVFFAPRGNLDRWRN